ncbi:MAG: hypothetical protein HQL37_00975, partial [Alphaproteobacteria bacterium]|nr:hypothetical protein [Alphaproteobacteria bacterium]
MLAELFVLGSIAYAAVNTHWRHRKQAPAKLPQTTIREPSELSGRYVVVPAASSSSVVSTGEPSTTSQVPPEAVIDRHLRMIGVAALASIATWFFPPASLIVVGIMSYAMIPLLESAVESTFIERKIRSNQLESLLVAVSLLSGYYLLASICSGVYFYGLKLVHKTQLRSKNRLEHLFGENPRQVWLSCDDTEVAVPFESLQAGDVIVLQAGEFVPIDGSIVRG